MFLSLALLLFWQSPVRSVSCRLATGTQVCTITLRESAGVKEHVQLIRGDGSTTIWNVESGKKTLTVHEPPTEKIVAVRYRGKIVKVK